MKVFKINGFFVDDGTTFSDFLVAEYDCTPSGYSDDDIFYYGIIPKQGVQYDDFIVTRVNESIEV